MDENVEEQLQLLQEKVQTGLTERFHAVSSS